MIGRREEQHPVEDSPPDLNDPRVAQAIVVRTLLHGLPGIRVAPDFSTRDWDFALNTYLPMRPDEALIALIPVIGVSLTTKRVYWGPTRWWQRLWDPFRVTAIPYADFRPGDENRLGLEGLPPATASVVRMALHRLAEASQGEPPRLESMERELVEVEGPAILAISARQTEATPSPLSFFTDLAEKTPRVVATPLLMLACLGVFLAMVVARVPFWMPSPERLLEWGADFGPLVMYRGERWRLISCMFVHVGIIHLAMNLWCLRILGPILERALGLPAFVTLYFASGIGGSLLSLWTRPVVVSAGASGAIFGLLGALGGYLVANHRLLPPGVRRPLTKSLLICVILNVALGEVVSILDSGAHLGGLMIGFLGGLMLSRPWPIRRNPWSAVRWALGTGSLAVVLVAAYGSASAAVRGNPQAQAWAWSDAIPEDLAQFREKTEWQAAALDAAKISLEGILGKYGKGEPAPSQECRKLERRLKLAEGQVREVSVDDPLLITARDALAESLDALRTAALAIRRLPAPASVRMLSLSNGDLVSRNIVERLRLNDALNRYIQSRTSYDRALLDYKRQKGLIRGTVAVGPWPRR